MGMAWSLQLSSPVVNPLREPSAFLLLSGARVAGLVLLGSTRVSVGSVGCALISVALVSTTAAVAAAAAGESCCADESSVLLP